MAASSIDYARLYSEGLPDPTPRFTPFPPYYFIGGNNDPEQIPIEGLIAAADTVLRREGSKLAIYNLGLGPQGYPGLRQFVADKSKRHRGIDAPIDDITITSGSGQGIDMISRLLVNPGDTVLVEEFCYQGAMNRFRKLGAKLEGMALDADGIVIDALAAQLASLKAKGVTPKFIYTIPTIQNPTGSILPLDRRHALIKLAREYNVAIFEDECYADLIWQGIDAPPALYALDPGCVIHLGSFSKSLAPALRLGYVIAEWEIMKRLLPLKGDSGTGALDQMVVAEYFSKHFDDHLPHLNTVLHDKLQTMIEAVEREFGSAAECWVPKGGIFLWIKLPQNVDVRTLIKPAADAGIVFNAGPDWAVSADNSSSHLRLCFAMPSKDVIRKGVAALAKVCYEQTGIPEQSGNVRRAG
ncbi:MAG: aminotransferase [Rhodospirillales bacterium 69-11]|nr:PLP-dependent aminotransferase family protein [Rhodospirillales bacterium]OJW24102.1 MAG: aminotransferase [Rhodospirillales bacterium 69-11]